MRKSRRKAMLAIDGAARAALADLVLSPIDEKTKKLCADRLFRYLKDHLKQPVTVTRVSSFEDKTYEEKVASVMMEEDQGLLVCNVEFTPPHPAEFIVVKLDLEAGTVDLEAGK